MTINFKPEFGNSRHVKIVEMIGELDQKEKKLAEKKDAAIYFTALKREIEKLKGNIARAIEDEAKIKA